MPWIIAGSSLISGALGADAADDASDASRAASRESIAENRRQFDLVRGDTQVSRDVGNESLLALSYLTGLRKPPTAMDLAAAQQSDTQADQDYAALQKRYQDISRQVNELEKQYNVFNFQEKNPGLDVPLELKFIDDKFTRGNVKGPGGREWLRNTATQLMNEYNSLRAQLDQGKVADAERQSNFRELETANRLAGTFAGNAGVNAGVNEYGINMNPDLYTLSNTDAVNPQNYAFDSSRFGVNPNNFGVDPSQFSVNPNQFGVDTNQFNVNPDNFGVNPNQFNVNPNDFGIDANQFSVNPAEYGVDTNQFRVDPSNFGVNTDRFSVDPSVGIDTSQYRVDPTTFDLSKDAGFQFRQEEGQRGLENMLSAQGRAMGGSALKEAMRFNQGFASNEFDKAYGRAVQSADRNLAMDFNVDRDRFEREFATTGRDYQFSSEQDRLAFDRLINTTGRDYQMMSDQDKQAFDRAFASAAQNYSMLSEQDRQAFDRAFATTGRGYEMASDQDRQAFERQFATTERGYDMLSEQDKLAFDRAFNTSGRNFQMAFDTDQARFDRAFQTDQTGYARAIGENQLGYERDVAANQTGYQRGLADLALRTDEYNRAYQRQQANLERLMSLAGFGSSGVAQSAQAGQNASSNISSILMQNAANQGNASMAGASAINNAIQGGLQNYYTSRLVNGTL